MPDETQLLNSEVVSHEPPVVEAPTTTPQEPVDETGVPWRNRVAEFQRKAEESEERNKKLQEALASYLRPGTAPAVAAPAEPAPVFDEPTRKFVRQIAEQVNYELLTKLSNQTALQENKDLMAAAEPIYWGLKSNPLWAQVPDTLVQNHAITEARTAILQKQIANGASQQATTVARTQSAGATLPATSLNTHPVGTIKNPKEEAFVANWKANPDHHKYFRYMFPRLDIDSEEGQKKLDKMARDGFAGRRPQEAA